jgi:ribonucleoside-triphosphate reductase (thioredoxin)
MYDKIFNFKFLPPGRGLWSMGSSITDKKKIYAALNNCAFVSTQVSNINNIEEIIKPYLFLMDSAMLGVGVGFDTKASQSGIKIMQVKRSDDPYLIIDSREGWVETLRILLKAYFSGGELPRWDYSGIRPAGTPLKTFGGVSSGYGPLKELHDSLVELLDKRVGGTVDSRLIVDIMNLIGRSVIAGNISKLF